MSNIISLEEQRSRKKYTELLKKLNQKIEEINNRFYDEYFVDEEAMNQKKTLLKIVVNNPPKD